MATSTKSIKLTILQMRMMGLWHSSSKSKQILSNVMLTLVFLFMLHAVFLQGQQLYYSRESITLIIYNIPLATVSFTETSKLAVFIYKRKKMMKLNKFVIEEFWKKKYTKEEIIIFNDCDQLCFKLICVYCALLLGTCALLCLILPIIEMFTDSDHKREFPYPVYIEPLLYESPYYEMYFALEIMTTLSVGLSVSTFASYLFAINLLTAAQFRILNMHLESLCDFEYGKNAKHQKEALKKLKSYVVKHQMLIELTKEIEDLYCYVMLEQVFGSIMQICFCGLQILLARTTLQRTILSVAFLFSSVMQLYFYCYSSHVIFEASESVLRAMYSMKWFKMTDPQVRREFSQVFRIITIRARRPCILTCGKFYPLTLVTFTSVLSTSLSYFTIFRQILY